MTLHALIRVVQPDDLNALVELCAAHAAYERAPYDPANKAPRLAADLFATRPKLYGLVVEQEGSLVGYATYMRQYATWDAADYIYLDCLYLKPEARGMGLGRQLMQRIQQEGRKLGCTLIQWQTPDFNTRAIQFYTRLGATSKAKERCFLEI